MNDGPGLRASVETLVGLLRGAEPRYTEDEVEGLLRDIERASRGAAPRERDAALRALGAALHAETLDEVSEALLIAACEGPVAAGGDPAPVAEAIVSFACVTLPVCCSYFLIIVSAPDEGEAGVEVTRALAPLRERFPQVGFEISALQWTAATLEALIRRDAGVAAELRESIFVGPSLYALAPSLPEARRLLEALDPALAARRPSAPPAPARPPRGPGPPRGGGGRGGPRRRGP